MVQPKLIDKAVGIETLPAFYTAQIVAASPSSSIGLLGVQVALCHRAWAW